MDPEVLKKIEEAIAKAMGPIVVQIEELKSSYGQVAEAGKKIGEIEGNLKILGDTVAGQKILDADGVKKIFGELTAAQRAEAEKQAAEQKARTEEEAKKTEAATALKAKRDAFVAEKLKGVPPKYHTLSDDEMKWAEEEKAIRQQFADDLKAAGIKVADLGGPAGGAPVEGEGQPANLNGIPAHRRDGSRDQAAGRRRGKVVTAAVQ